MRCDWLFWARVVGVFAVVSAASGCSDQHRGTDGSAGSHPDAEDTRSQAIVPDGSASDPDGSASDPDGSAPDPDGSAPDPDGSAPDPDGSASDPDGSAPDAGELADPGAPQTEYGTKGEAHLFLGDKEVGYIFFAALAPERADLAHVFFRPEHGGSVGVTDYYVSLILDRAVWRAGAYSGALGGRATIKLSTGAEYQSKATEASVTATLTRATVIESNVYLDGQLTMVLAATSGGEPLRVEVALN